MELTTKELFQHIRRIQIKTLKKVNSLFAGAYHSAFKGVGLEFEDVREYQIGDDADLIHWPLTARMQRPYIKNFREERELTVLLVIDISASTRYGSNELLKSDMIAEIGALLAFSAIKNHDKVGLVLFSEDIEFFIKPKKNLRHVLRVIREILFFKPKNKGTNFQRVFDFLGKIQKKNTICFFISDFLTHNLKTDPIQRLSKQNEMIFIEIFDAYEQTFPNLGLAYMKDLEGNTIKLIDTSDKEIQEHFKMESAERRNALKKTLTQSGVDLISIRTDESYANALRKFFKLRGRKR